jgi:uncharacterized delta-60 repeat protein
VRVGIDNGCRVHRLSEEIEMKQNKLMWGALSAALVFTGCGDDDGGSPDAGSSPDAPSTVDAPVPTPDGAPDATPGGFPPAPIALAFSARGHDQLQSAVAAPGGGFYAAGYTTALLDGAKDVIVVKLTDAGALDTTWSGDGIASTGLVFIGSDDEIDLALQSDGKIVVSAAVPHASAGNEDAAVARLNADGTVDTMFGVAGKRSLGLNPSTGGNAGPRGIAVDGENRIYVHAVERQERPGKPSTFDVDFAMVRLTANGAIDASFSGDGKQLLNIRGRAAADSDAVTDLGGTVRGVSVLDDGSVIGSGYLTNHFITAGPSAVVYKLDEDGEFVAGFGTPGGVSDVPVGVFHARILGHQAEVYNVAVSGDKLVTAGYGREAASPNNNLWVSARLDATTGALDPTWGAPNGFVTVRPSELSSNNRNVAALPGGKVLLIGSTGPVSVPMGDPAQPATRDAAFVILDSTGAPDAAYGAKAHAVVLGEGQGGNDQFWGAAVSETSILMVGWKGSTSSPASATDNDDAYALVIPLAE